MGSIPARMQSLAKPPALMPWAILGLEQFLALPSPFSLLNNL